MENFFSSSVFMRSSLCQTNQGWRWALPDRFQLYGLPPSAVVVGVAFHTNWSGGRWLSLPEMQWRRVRLFFQTFSCSDAWTCLGLLELKNKRSRATKGPIMLWGNTTGTKTSSKTMENKNRSLGWWGGEHRQKGASSATPTTNGWKWRFIWTGNGE